MRVLKIGLMPVCFAPAHERAQRIADTNRFSYKSDSDQAGRANVMQLATREEATNTMHMQLGAKRMSAVVVT